MTPRQLSWEEYDTFDGEHVLLDVREDSEWAEGHVAAALHLPLGVVAERARDLVPDLATPVVVCCRSGGRAARAANELLALGYRDVAFVVGDAGPRYL